MALDRVKVTINGGGVIGAAAMNWYFTSATATNLSAISTYLTAFKTYMPSGCTYVIPGNGDTINEVDGGLVGGWSAGGGISVVSTGVSASPGQAGGMTLWTTGAVVDGRRPKGRALLVPLNSGAFATGGGMLPAWVTAAQNAASAFLTASSGFSIWHRPVFDRSGPGAPVLERPGSSVPVTGFLVSTVAATLRSRNH